MNEYSADQADARRPAIADASVAVQTWYPTVEERTTSRELRLIPPGSRLAGARRVVARGGANPDATPWPQAPPEATQSRLFTSPDITDRLEMIAGEFPAFEDPNRSAEPILQVVLGEQLASLAQLEVGDRVVLRAFTSLPDAFEMVEVAGIARAVDPDAIIWDAVSPGLLVFVGPEAFDLWTGTFSADPGGDPWLRAERGFRRLTATRTFTLHLDREAVTLEGVQDLQEGVLYFTVPWPTPRASAPCRSSRP